jgi:hypothetical protein
MSLNAYILVADPTWIEASVRSYYDVVGEIIVSYDRNGQGWTGTPIAVDECLARLRKIDHAGKMRFCPGDFACPGRPPFEGETHQRQVAIDEASRTADWVLQLDTDELLPNPAALLDALREADAQDIPALEWPMRVLFYQLRDGRYLEVCSPVKTDHFEYPAPVAVRAGTRLAHARRTHGLFLRPAVAGDDCSLQIRRPLEERERRMVLERASDAILHNSWARSPANIKSKISSWGHNGWRSWLFYYTRWSLTPYRWQRMRDLHPFGRDLWPALRVCNSPALDSVAQF